VTSPERAAELVPTEPPEAPAPERGDVPQQSTALGPGTQPAGMTSPGPGDVMPQPAALRPMTQPAQVTLPGTGEGGRAGGGPAGLRVLARGAWSGEEGTPPAVAGFVGSWFSPSVAVAADRCLVGLYGGPPAADGAGTALVLISSAGDTGTAGAVADALDRGRRVPPLLFFQSNPNAVLGHIAARWDLRGPVVALGSGHPEPEAEAALLLADGDADRVLVLTAEPGRVTAALYAPAAPTP
jgi:hypothetical protein